MGPASGTLTTGVSDARHLYRPDTYIGRVSNGIVILEGATVLPDGTTVRVEPIAVSADPIAGTRRILLAWDRRAEAERIYREAN